jgi:hypothetical protein
MGSDKAASTMMCAVHKLRATFITPSRHDLLACLEACRVADAVVLVGTPAFEVDAVSDRCLTALRLQVISLQQACY